MLDLLPSNIIYNIAKFISIEDCKSLAVVNKKINRSIKHWFNIDDFTIIKKFENCTREYYKNNILSINYDGDSNIILKECFQNGKRYRDNGLPSRIHYYKNGDIRLEEWFNYCDNSIEIKYSRIEYDSNGNIKSQGSYHNISPKIHYHKNDNIWLKEWDQGSSIRNNNDFPERTDFYDDGNIQFEIWFQNDELHRDNDLPALIEYYKNGNIKSQAWYQNYSYHRKNNKPMRICYFENGNIRLKNWSKYIGEKYSNLPCAMKGPPGNGHCSFTNYYYIHTNYHDNSYEYNNNKPSLIEYYENGNIKIKKWSQNTCYNNIKLVKKSYYENGNIKSEIWSRRYDYSKNKKDIMRLEIYYQKDDIPIIYIHTKIKNL